MPVENIYLLSIIVGISDILACTSFKFLASRFQVKSLLRAVYVALVILTLAFFFMIKLSHGKRGGKEASAEDGEL